MNIIVNDFLSEYIDLFPGTPIKDFSIQFHDTIHNFYTENEAQYRIPVKGPSGNGWYVIRAEPRGENGKWVGVKLELEIDETSMLEEDKYKDKRLVIFDCNRNGNMVLEE